jgi:hypothetical protein
MKKIWFVLLVMLHVCAAKQLRAQQKLTIKALVGVWQYASPRIGDQLNQSFVFFGNGDFFFNNGKLGDDLVATLVLKGRYRLDRNKMYFTIISKTIMDDSVGVGVVNPVIAFGIFEYKDMVPKEIIEKNPKEIEDPGDITAVSLKHIKINDEDYYKVSSDPNKAGKL